MTQLSVAPAADPSQSRAARIRGAVAQGQLERAKSWLLDLTHELNDRDAQDEAVLLASRLAQAAYKESTFGADMSAERNQITATMLELLRRIEDAEQTRRSRTTLSPPAPADARPPASRRPPQLAVVRETEGDSRPISGEVPITRLEKARRDFDEARERPSAAEGVTCCCQGLGKRYAGRSASFSLQGLSLTLRRGQILGLVGENGSGKTTLLRIIAGELLHTEGELCYPDLGAPREPVHWPSVRPQIAYVPQSPEPWYGPLSTTLHVTAAQHGFFGKQNQREVDFWIHRLGLDAYRSAYWSQISGGYKMRFELARALIRQPKLLVLDEPLAPLDIIAQRTFLQDLSDLASSQRAPLPMVVSSQHIYEIELVAHELLFLRGGKAGYLGPPNGYTSKDGGSLFELACDWPREKIERTLLALAECRVEEFGRRVLVRSARAIDARAALGVLLKEGATIAYFHDLSRSTRRLFEDGQFHD
jgi:ABC-2 type transport system ATP-binding protein